MSFRVVATPEAEDELASCWLRAKDRKAVTAAQHRIEQLLMQAPKNSGQELAEQLWKIEVPPLVAYFEIDELQQEITLTGFALLH